MPRPRTFKTLILNINPPTALLSPMSANLAPGFGLELRLGVVLGGLLFNRVGRVRRSPKWSVEILPGSRGRDIVQDGRVVPVGALASIREVTFCTDKAGLSILHWLA